MTISMWPLAMVEYGEPTNTMLNQLVLEARGLSANTMAMVAAGQVHSTKLPGNNWSPSRARTIGWDLRWRVVPPTAESRSHLINLC